MVPTLLLVTLNVLPFVCLYVLRRNRAMLHYSPMQRKFGTLYLGLDPRMGPVEWASFVFFVRRSLFVAMTFGFVAYPALQLLIFIFTTLVYLAIINHMGYHAQRSMLYLENFNEFMFMCVCYLLILFCNLLPDKETKELVG